MPTESLYVNAFSAAIMNWNTHTGVTPYLQAAAGNSIGAFTNGVVDDSFTFADTAITDFATIASIKLRGKVMNTIDHFAVLFLTGVSGGAWSQTVYAEDDGSGTFTSVDLKATINSIARINEVAMKATKQQIGTGTLNLSQVYLEIITAEVGGVIRRLLVKVGL